MFAGVLMLCISVTGGGVSRRQKGNAPGTPSGWYFGVIGCPHWNWNLGGTTVRNSIMLAAVIDTLNDLGAKFLLMDGDIAEDLFQPNTNANLDSFLVQTGRANFEIWPVLGNHEAYAADTANGGSPYASATSRWSAFFGNADYYVKDYLNIRLIVTQNNADIDTSSSADYRVNNPFGSGYEPGIDFDGIRTAASPQRQFISQKASSAGSRILLLAGHRAIYGDSASTNGTRANLNQGRSGGFVRAVEQAVTPRNFVGIWADQHIYYRTPRIADSTVVSGTTPGGYHFGLASGSGLRGADTTAALAPQWDAYILQSPDGLSVDGRTTEGVVDTVTTASGVGVNHVFVWTLGKVEGDAIYFQTFVTFSSEWASNPLYTGSGSHILVDKWRWSMDNGS